MKNHIEDYHIHSEFSDDCTYPIEDVIKHAIHLGLSEICFTDHVDYGPKRDFDDPRGIPVVKVNGKDWAFSNVDYPRYVETIRHLQEKYSDQITIKLGLEFGIQTHTIPEFEKLFARYPFDFIILSIHQIENQQLFIQTYQNSRSQAEYNLGYYKEMLSVVQNFHNYSVLGHMDLITRYDHAGIYPFEHVKPIITEILKQVIADGKGIEFNTSFRRYNLPDSTPSREILKLYKELGGTIITIGSDSHAEEHLGVYIQEAKQLLKELGFSKYCTYEQMKPIFHNL